MPILTTTDSGKVEVLLARYHNLVEETNSLKLVIEMIQAMRAGFRLYAGCKKIDDHFKDSELLVMERVAEIEVYLKAIDDEAKKLTDFIKEPPRGDVQ